MEPQGSNISHKGDIPVCKIATRNLWLLSLLLTGFIAGCGVVYGTKPTPSTQTPTLSSISPNSATQGQSVSITLMGAYFASGATIGLSGTGITASNTTVVSSTQITATFVIAANAPVTAQNVTVTSSGG